MAEKPISKRQLVRLQTLWAMLMRHVGATLGSPADGASPAAPTAKDREARLAWVGAQIGRQIASFNDLTEAEAGVALDKIQACLPAELIHRPPRRRAGRGRRGKAAKGKVAALPSAADWAALEAWLAKVGWTREQLDAWLTSGRTAPCRKVRSRGDVVAVIEAMKNMLRRDEQKKAFTARQEEGRAEEVRA